MTLIVYGLQFCAISMSELMLTFLKCKLSRETLHFGKPFARNGFM
jgi:hypothetical protein